MEGATRYNRAKGELSPNSAVLGFAEHLSVFRLIVLVLWLATSPFQLSLMAGSCF